VVKKVLNMDSFFAVTAPGLEPFTAQELRLLDLEPATAPGGVFFIGDLTALYRANLHLRTASRILARLGNFFYATTFPELQQRLARLPWERFLTPGQPVSLRATCHKSKLYHSDAVAQAVSTAIEQRLGGPSPILKANEDSNQPPQLVVVRLVDDKCTVSVDSSGRLLHKRGYRQAVAKAPLRETLAAALLMASGWDKVSPLLDPFCGSGTIPIEAALMALGIPPGIDRRFAFMDWPGYDTTLWQSIHGPSSTIHTQSPVILASDRDAGAIKIAQANAGRAGVADFIEFRCQAVSSITPSPGPGEVVPVPGYHPDSLISSRISYGTGRGWVVTNPPYGLRLSEGKDLRNLYAQFGNVLREKCPGWNLSVLCSDPALLGQMQVRLDTSLSLVNGGIRVRLGRGKVG
jgi:putative N6-adenine-specific DNA methylase